MKNHTKNTIYTKKYRRTIPKFIGWEFYLIKHFLVLSISYFIPRSVPRHELEIKLLFERAQKTNMESS